MKSYEVRKGWPQEGALDEVLTAATGQTITDGMIVTVAGGKATPATFSGATGPMPAFVIGIEAVRGTITALMNDAIIEVDAAYYDAGSYTPGDNLSAKDGKFCPAGSNKVIARVLSFDATTGIMRVMWFAAR